MDKLLNNEITDIENIIYEIDGVEVMLDSDLANLYQVETKRINEAVKNNPEKFPDRFSKILTKEEEENLRSKFSTSSLTNNYGGRRYNTRIFTEQGVYMLATILKSKVATEVNIRIMDTFVKMRHYINYNDNLLPNKILLLEDRVDQNSKRIDELFDMFNPKEITKDKLFFEGEFYNAHSFLLDILNKARNEIILIDNYAGKELLDALKEIDKKIIVVSKNINKELIKIYKKQYNNVSFINNDSLHDRFIILDRYRIFTCGASFKELGKKCFYIGEIDSRYAIDILKEIENKD